MTNYPFLMYILPYLVWFLLFCLFSHKLYTLEGLFKDKLHEECFQVFSHRIVSSYDTGYDEGLFATQKAIIIQIMMR